MIKVSIIVPVYNVEKYLDKCLNSLVNQTLKEIEIIVVNDGTKDNSQKIIDQYKEKYPDKVFAYLKENGGLSSARNYGLKKAKGQYVAFVDSDDFVDVNMYDKMYSKAKEYDFDLVCCDFNEIREGKQKQCSCKIKEDLLNPNHIKMAMEDFYPSAWNKIYKNSLLKTTRTFFKEAIWFEDVEFIYRLLPFVSTIGVVHENFYQYLIREGSITSTNDLRIYHYIENWNGLIDFYKEKNLYDEYKELLEYNYVRYLYATFIKTAAKFDKNEYRKAVKKAIYNVKYHFPDYKKNVFINKGGFKNLYLKYFSSMISKLVYWKYNR